MSGPLGMTARRLLVAVGIIGFGVGVAGAELPAPKMMPGFPMLAGPNVMVMWMPVPGAVKYNVYMNGQKVGETPAVNYMAPSPEKAGEYVFEVAAVDAGGKEGPKAIGKIKIIKLEPPTGLAAMTRGDRVALRWDTTEGAVIYNIYRSENKDDKGELLGSVQTTKFDDTKLEDGKTYYYRVSARDMSGAESAPSEPLQVKYEKPKAAAKARKKIEQILIRAEGLKCTRSAGMDLLGFPGDLAYDPKADALYVVDGAARRVFVFDGNLEFLAAWPPDGARYELNLPSAVAVDPSGEPIYVSNQNSILALDANGGLIWEVELPKATKDLQTPLKGGNAIAVAEDGTVYVCDSHRKQVGVFDPTGRFISAFGFGKYAGTLGSLRVTSRGTLLATDTLAAKVLEINPEDGSLIRSFGQFGVVPGKFGRADVVFPYADNKVIVADSMATLLHFYDLEGSYLGDLAIEADGNLQPLPAISTYGVVVEPKKGVVYWSEKLEHDLCRVVVPELP